MGVCLTDYRKGDCLYLRMLFLAQNVTRTLDFGAISNYFRMVIVKDPVRYEHFAFRLKSSLSLL